MTYISYVTYREVCMMAPRVYDVYTSTPNKENQTSPIFFFLKYNIKGSMCQWKTYQPIHTRPKGN